MPDTFNLVINADHPVVGRIVSAMSDKTKAQIEPIMAQIGTYEARKAELNKAKEGKKEEEIPQTEKDEMEALDKQIEGERKKRADLLASFAKDEKLVSQLIDLALLSNNMLKGQSLTNFIKRSVSLM